MQTGNGCGLCRVEIEKINVLKDGECLLDNVSFTLHCGELTALIGVNGAGKTTLLRAILGEVKHTGKVRFEGHDGTRLDKITIGYVPQHLDFDRSTPISVEDFLLLGRTNRPVSFAKSKKIIKDIYADLEKSGCKGLEKRTLGELSGGEIQKVMLLQALYPVPELLILDEPVSGVDTIGSEQFYESISALRENYHIAIIMVSHDLELVKKYADKVLLVNKQVLKHGTVNEVYNSKEFRKEFLSGGASL